MRKPVYKVLLFLKRNAAMSLEEFRHAYETVHAPWGKELMLEGLSVCPALHDIHRRPHAEGVSELDFDVITELWYQTPSTLRTARRG